MQKLKKIEIKLLIDNISECYAEYMNFRITNSWNMFFPIIVKFFSQYDKSLKNFYTSDLVKWSIS